MNPNQRSFASDNNAGVHPQIMRALAEANLGHAVGYGSDPWTAQMQRDFCQAFGREVSVYPVFNGTGANVTGLSAMLKPHQAVLCAAGSHLNLDECAAPERLLGNKLIPLPSPPDRGGKIAYQDVERWLQRPQTPHQALPRVLSLTQCTEWGALYSLQEMRALADLMHAHGGYLHVDGARIANAAAALGCDFRQLLVDTGVDLVAFGGTKNGLLCGEAVVILNSELAGHFDFLRKQGMQLFSKMRFLAVQLSAYLKDDFWRHNALWSQARAQELALAVSELDAITLVCPVETNAVFARIPQAWVAPLQELFFFYVLHDPECPPEQRTVRWMMSFDTQPEDIQRFAQALHRLSTG